MLSSLKSTRFVTPLQRGQGSGERNEWNNFIYLKRRKGGNQPFGYPRVDPSTALRTCAQDLLSPAAGRQGLILSGAFDPVLKVGFCFRPELLDRTQGLEPVQRLRPRFAVEVSNLSLEELRDLLNDVCGYQRFLSYLSGHEIPG